MKPLDVDDYVDEIQSVIKYCYNCQPYEQGSPVWVMGDEIELEEVFDEFNVPEDLRDKVADNLHCDFCGTQLQRGDSVAYATPSETELNKKLGEWELKYKKEFKRFSKHIEKYPYLASVHPFATKIMESLKSMKKLTVSGEWYQSRNIKDGKQFSNKDMKNPNPKKHMISEGRYNHFGQSNLYLSDNNACSAFEIIDNQESIVWIQKFELKEYPNILRLSYDKGVEDLGLEIIMTGLLFSEELEKPVKKNYGWKPEYFVPRFIADAAKKEGFKGISI